MPAGIPPPAGMRKSINEEAERIVTGQRNGCSSGPYSVISLSPAWANIKPQDLALTIPFDRSATSGVSILHIF